VAVKLSCAGTNTVMIVKKNNKYQVKDSSGKKLLGEHSTRKEALRQLRAIEISKRKK